MEHNEAYYRWLSDLRRMRTIIFDTVELMLDRRALRPDYGWIDLKLDAITGVDQFDISGARDKDHIYSWIQGRGLEAVVTHIQWFGDFSGIATPDREALIQLGRSVAHKLIEARESQGGHFNFILQTEPGKNGSEKDGRYTMSDIFCARGLYAFHAVFGTTEQHKQSKAWLKAVIAAVISGNFYNDQLGFDKSQYQAYADGRTSYAGHMIALGAVSLLMRLDADDDAITLGRQLVDAVLEKHMNRDHRWTSFPMHTIVEWIAADGNPARDGNGCIALNPGHAVEFVGLAAQMIDTLRTCYPENRIPVGWMDRIKSLLVPLLAVNLQHGYREPGGIVTSVDAETGSPLHNSMPWWSLPESMRAIALVEHINNPDEWSELGKSWFNRFFDAFDNNYRKPSACKIAMQTIDTRGDSVSIIPATPDLDPGYHTGLSLISCYDIIAKKIPLALESIEVDITPEIGTRLSGHAARTRVSEKILDPLMARVCLLETPYAKHLLVSADLLELPAISVDRLRGVLSELLDIGKDHMTIATTHTHTAPPVIDLGTLEADGSYFDKISHRIADGCGMLGSNMIFVSALAVTCSIPLGINRRYRDADTGSISMRPNPSGSRDDEVNAIVFRDGEEKVRTIFIQTSVHPTTLGVSLALVSADYPGGITRRLKQHFGEHVVVLPFTGACGDVRPALLDATGAAFREGDEDDVENMGVRIADEVVKVYANADKSSWSPIQAIRYSSRTIGCAFHSIPTREQLLALRSTNGIRLAEARRLAQGLDDFMAKHNNPVWDVEVEQSWVDHLLRMESIPTSIEAELTVLALGDVAVLCMVPGELFSTIGKRIKDMVPHMPVLVVGYANGSLGYLPGKDAVDEGGYEVAVAYKYYGLPGPFTKDLEDQLLTTIETMLGEVDNGQ